jgi:hypothetical protein
MYRIDNIEAAVTLPTPKPLGTPGFFQGGNPSAGLKATTVDADWLNTVQEEISHVIETAGITLSKSDRTQLAQALQTMVGGRYLGTQVFLTPGAASYTPNPLMRLVRVRMQGAGGGAGGVAAVAGGQASISCAGQSGHYGEAVLTRAALGTLPVALVIGAGGTAGAAGAAGAGSQGGNGGPGGLTSFGSPIILQQPGGGYGLGGGIYSASITVIGAGTTAANTTGFNLVIPGIQAEGGSLLFISGSEVFAQPSVGPGSHLSNGTSGSGAAPGQDAGGFGGAGGGTGANSSSPGFVGGKGSGAVIAIDEFS